jgi:cell pole-organizing protein PopZ
MKTGEVPSSDEAEAAEIVSEQEPGSDNGPGDRPASEVMASTIAALEQLALLRRKAQQEEPRPQTFEDAVSELMRPMLQDWLDKSVPKLVERIVRPELRRALDGY